MEEGWRGGQLMPSSLSATALLGMTTTTSLLPSQTVTRKVFVQRDYSHGVGVRFAATFPADLSGRIDDESFNYLISKVNRLFDEAERLSLFSILDSLVGCLTAYLIFLCYDSYYDRCLKRVSRLIEDQNEQVWKPKGLLLTDPKDRGLRCIEITIFEPAIRPNGTAAPSDLSGYQETALE